MWYAGTKGGEAGRREGALNGAKAPAALTSPLKAATKPARRKEREVRKEISTVEKTIARLDEQKRVANGRLLESTDAAEALRLHNEVADLTAQLAAAEERWCKLQEEIEV